MAFGAESSALDLRDVTLHLGPQLVLSGISATIAAGDRLAVVGPNGVGKTTLLRLLAGELTPDSGAVVRRPAAATVGLLPQERDARPGEPVAGYLARRTGVDAAEAELEAATTALSSGQPGADDRYATALERYLALGAAEFPSRAPAVLADLGLDADRMTDPVTSLSGGQLARLALASILLARFDLLLLDEPTNDLDVDGLEILEGFLGSRAGGLAVVSHDRTFLERVATDVLEIDEFARTGKLFGGGFATYVLESERARTLQQEAYEKYIDRREAMVAQARRQKEWARQGAAREKRNPKDNDKMLRDARIEGAQNRMAKAAAVERAVERLDKNEAVEEPRTGWELRMRLETSARSGDRVAGLTDVVVERGGFTLGPLSLDIRYGDRLAIVGPNGSGKSTLLAVLLGRLVLTSGDRWIGRGVVLGEIDQRFRSTVGGATGATGDGAGADMSLLIAFKAAAGIDEESQVRSLLAKFGLEAGDVLRPIGSLSPGERTRADLALLVARQANLLVLDEPTNHLDLPAVQQLEQALASYDGTLVLVSHDRRLVDAIEPTHRLELANGDVVST